MGDKMKLKSIPILLIATAFMLLVGCAKDIPPEVVYSKFNHATALITTATGWGTGIIIDQGKYVLTANHVVEGHSKITIKHPSMKAEQYGTVLSYDILADMALLKPSLPISIDNYPKVSTSEPVVGSEITVIGYPMDPRAPSTLTKGVISSTSSDKNGIEYIKLDAAVNPGNNGGPVFSERGNIIGLIVLKRMESEGESWAVSSLTLSELLPKLKSYTHSLTDTGGGAIVSGQALPGSIEIPGDTDTYIFSGTYGAIAQIKLQGDGTVFKIGSNSETTSGSYYMTRSGTKTYTIVVSSPSVTHGDPKPYTLTFTYADPPDDTGGGTIISGQALTGSIEMPDDTDTYIFSGTYGAHIDITLSGNGTLFTLKQQKDGYESCDASNYYPTTTVASDQTAFTAFTEYLPGYESQCYAIIISSPSITHGDPKPYTLTLTYTDPPDDTGGGAIISGQALTGSIEMPDDIDTYIFSGTYGAHVDITLSGNEIIFTLKHRTDSYSCESYNSYYSTILASNQTAFTEYLTGSASRCYTIVVSSPSVTHGGPKPYTLTLTYTDSPADTGLYAGTTERKIYTQEIGSSSPSSPTTALGTKL